MNKIKVIAIMGKAGAGKDTIMNKLYNYNPIKYNRIVSYTSRPQREHEKEGVDYYYLTKEEFIKNIELGQMFEYTEFNGWYYGTGINSLVQDKINIGVFNPAGVYSLSKCKNIDLTVYYINASDKNRLLRQLNREENPVVSEIIRRYSTDENDFFNLAFKYQTMENNNLNDLDDIVKKIDWAN